MEEEQVHGKLGCSAAEQSTGDDHKLRRAINSISCVITLCYTIRVFSGKWQMIRSRLEELKAGLEAAENCQTSGGSRSVSKLVEAIHQTVGECHDLASRCIRITYSGKLLMQSDLDVVLGKLELHIKRLTGFYAAGVLSNGSDIVVSKPGPDACRDDLRFYVNDLAARMKIGDMEMKIQALGALNEIVLESERCLRIVVDSDEIMNLLPNLLDSTEIEIQEMTAQVISVISGFESHNGLLVGVGIISPLVRVLECGSAKAKECAVQSLFKLTENSDNAWSVSAHGGVTSLLHICCDEKDEKMRSQLINSASSVLRNLISVEEIKRFLVEGGAIQAFIKLLKSTDERTQVSSIEFLQTMAEGDDSVRLTILKEGGIDNIIRLINLESSSSSNKSRETALKAVENLCFSSAESLTLLMSHNFINQLLSFLQRGDVSLQELAFKVAFKLCGTSKEAKKAMGDAGFLSEFMKFLESNKSYEISEMAAETISSMVMVPSNRKRFAQEERNTGVILELLDNQKAKSCSPRNLKFLVSTLLAVSSCNGVRRRILNSGSLRSIERLAESGVYDAKKIIRKVSSNRFQKMVKKVLHIHV